MKYSLVVLVLALATFTSALPNPGGQDTQAGSPGSSWGGHGGGHGGDLGGDHGGHHGPGGWGPPQQKQQQQNANGADDSLLTMTKSKRESPAEGDSPDDDGEGAYKTQSAGKQSGFWGPVR